MLAGAALALAPLLAGCGDSHRGMHCVRSHDESYLLPLACGKGCVMFIPQTDTVCDEWLPDSPAPGTKKPPAGIEPAKGTNSPGGMREASPRAS